MKMLDEFKRTAGDLRIIEGAADREMYSQDIGDLPPVMTRTLFGTLPDFVVQPATVEEIRKVLTRSYRAGPPRGASAASSPPGAASSSTCPPSAGSWRWMWPARP
jgi:hypothetical protein